MKRYIITEEELKLIQHCCTPTPQEELDVILAREIPEWATHFADLKTEWASHGERTVIMSAKEIPK